METIIKLSPSELNEKLIEKIRSYIGEKTNVDVIISLKEYDKQYFEDLKRSAEEAESGKGLVTFTMEEFMSYTPRVG